jgi:hypothetical protein
MTASKFYDWRQRYGRVNEIRRSRHYFVATQLFWPLVASVEFHFPVDHTGPVTTIEKLHNFLCVNCRGHATSTVSKLIYPVPSTT